MKLKSLIVSIVLALLLACVSVGDKPEKYVNLEQTAIEWLQDKLTEEVLELAEGKPVPEIFYVDADTINEIGRADCVISGGTPEQCTALEDLFGKFDFDSQDIYIEKAIFESMTDCEAVGLIIHEMLHWYQFLILGDWRGNGMQTWATESEASGAQGMYWNEACPEVVAPKEGL